MMVGRRRKAGLTHPTNGGARRRITKKNPAPWSALRGAVGFTQSLDPSQANESWRIPAGCAEFAGRDARGEWFRLIRAGKLIVVGIGGNRLQCRVFPAGRRWTLTAV